MRLPIVLFCLVPLLAQEDDPAFRAAWESARSALARGEHALAEPILRELCVARPERVPLRFELGRCQVALGADEAAIATFRALLEDHPEHGASACQLALLVVASEPDAARALLLRAARNGYDVLGLLEHPALAALRDDIDYVLEVIAAPQSWEPPSDLVVDPFHPLLVSAFAPPVVVEPEPAPAPAPEPTRGEGELLAAVEALLDALEDALAARGEDEVLSVFADLEALLGGLSSEDPALQPRVQTALGRYNRLASAVYGVRLARFERLAAAGLAALHEAIEALDFPACARRWRELDAHLRGADDDLLHAAEPWREKALAARSLSLQLEEASGLALSLTGIVFGDDEDAPVAEAIVNGSIARAGDTVFAHDGTALAGLRVLAVERHGVLFAFRDVTFRQFLGVDDFRSFAYELP